MDDLEISNHVEPSVFNDDEDDPFAVPPPLAPLPSGEDDIANIAAENGVENLNNEEGSGATGEEKKKKRASRPRLKLDEQRLCSPKGIAALKNLPSKIDLKGKGHEESDLNKLLQQFEHWAQCLMPSWTFQNVVRQCEKLGTKRIVQNELKRIRRGDDDEVLRGESDNEDAAAQGETVPPAPQEAPQMQPPEDELPDERPPPLTEEQLKRIRKNRELAMARREALQKRKMLAEREAESRQTDLQSEPSSSNTGDEILQEANEENHINEGTAESTDIDQDATMRNNKASASKAEQDEMDTREEPEEQTEEIAVINELHTEESNSLEIHNQQDRNLSDNLDAEKVATPPITSTINSEDDIESTQNTGNVENDAKSKAMEYTTSADMAEIQNKTNNENNTLSEKEKLTVTPIENSSFVQSDSVPEEMDTEAPL